MSNRVRKVGTVHTPRAPSYLPPLAARAPAAMLALGTTISLLLHLGLGAATLDQPIGYVDSNDGPAEPSLLRIKRATYDLVLTPSAPPARDDTTVEQLSQSLLDQTEAADDSQLATELQLPDPVETAPQSEDALAGPGEPLALAPLALGAALEELAYETADRTGFNTYGPADADSAVVARRMLAVTRHGPASGLHRDNGLGPPVRIADENLLERTIDQITGELAAVPLAPPRSPKVDLAPPQPLDNDFEYHLTRHEQADEAGYFRVQIVARRSLRKLKAMPKDVVFLADTSRSLPQSWVNEAVRGIKGALSSLNDGDRFNVVLFNERVHFFDPNRIQPANPQNVARASAFLSTAQSKGYTDVNAALSRLLERDIAANRVYDLVLITDGRPTRGVLDTRDLINLITRDNDLAASIYCVGIGPKANRQLLDFLAYRNKGYCVFANQRERVAATIIDLLSRIRYPLIKDATHHVAGPQVGRLYPIDLPNIHQGERFSLYGRYGHAGAFTTRVAGSSANGPVDFTFHGDLVAAPLGEMKIRQGWAFWKLHHLYSEIIRLGENPQLLQEVDELRHRYQLQTLY